MNLLLANKIGVVMLNMLKQAQGILDTTKGMDFLPLLLLRAYLVPVFWMAGVQKLNNFESTVSWFGNSEWGLGLPLPLLMTVLVIIAELGGAILLAIGLAVRWVSIPMMFTMIVAATSVHLKNGWLAISTGQGLFATERTMGAIERLDRMKAILKQHGNYEWLTENGSVVILNNGIEFAATYFVMLLVLFFMGGGKYVGVDYWIERRVMANS